MNILVSACLLGISCKYDGGSNLCPELIALTERPDIHLIPFCPEVYGGLPTPRVPSELLSAVPLQVVSSQGTDVTAAFSRGAEEALRVAHLYHCTAAILKERSPSCGHGRIYDGTFQHRVIAGDGVTASLLAADGIRIYGESQIAAFLTESHIL